MSRENVKKFYDLVENDASLKKELEGLNEKIKVSQTDLNNLRGLVEKEIIPVAKKRGLDFTAEELLTYANDKYMKLTEEDLMDISGGISAKNSAIGLSAVLLLSLGSTAAINLLTPNNNLNQSISSSKPKDTSEEKNDDVDNKVDNKNDDVNNKVDKKNDNSRNANNSRDLKLAKNELEALKNKEIEVPNVRRNVEDNAGGNSSNNVKEFNNETIIKQNPEYNMQNSNRKQAKTLKDFLEEVLRVQKEKAAGAAKNDTTANFSGENSKEETREKQVKDDHNSNEDVNQKEEIKAQSNVGEQETRLELYRDVHAQDAQNQDTQDSQNAQNVQSAQDANKEVAQGEDTKKETPKVDKKLEKINAKNAVNDAKEKIKENIIRIYNDAKKENGGILDEAGIAKLIQRSDIADNIPFKENILIQVDLGEKNSTVEIKYNNKELDVTQEDKLDVGKVLNDLNKKAAAEQKEQNKISEAKLKEQAKNAVSDAKTKLNDAIKNAIYDVKKTDKSTEEILDDVTKNVELDENIVIDKNGNRWTIKYKLQEVVIAQDTINIDKTIKDLTKIVSNEITKEAKVDAKVTVGKIQAWIIKMYREAVTNNNNKPLNVKDFLYSIDIDELIEALPKDDFGYTLDYDYEYITIKIDGLDVIDRLNVKELVNNWNNHTKQVYKQAEKKETAEQIRKETEAKKQAELEAKQKAEAQRKAEKEKAEQVRKETEAKKQAEQAKENLKSSYSGLTGITTARVTAANNLAEFLYNNVNINENDSKQEIKEKIEKNVKLTDMEQLINDIKEIRSYISGNEQDGYSIRRSGVIAHLPFTAKEDNIETANAKLIINVYDALN